LLLPVLCTAQTGVLTRIIGGSDTDIEEIPFQVSLKNNSTNCLGNHSCGGSIINEEWILTAAHCVDGSVTPDDITVLAGSTNQTLNDGQFIKAKSIVIHPNWINYSEGNDIALIHLSKPLCFNQKVKPVTYNNTSIPASVISANNIATLSGWGKTSQGSGCIDILQSVQIPIISNTDAETLLTNCGNPDVLDNMISFFESSASAGSGDSGGPAFTMYNGVPLLIGVASWACTIIPGFPSVYTNVRSHSDFITQTISTTLPNTITHIYSNTTFMTDQQMAGDIHIHSGAQLVVESEIGMPSGTRILVERNARLIVRNGGILTTACNSSNWDGVRVLGNSILVQPEWNVPLNNPDQTGIVVLDNGHIYNALVGISAGGGYGSEYWGGLIDCKNSIFRSNRKAVEFMSYKIAPNKSKFKSVDFLETIPNSGGSVNNSEGVTIWETDNIVFESCSFGYFDNEGIRTFDASIRVLNDCLFRNNDIGISSNATYPASYITKIAVGNNFLDNKYHILSSLATGLSSSAGQFSLEVTNNSFSGGQFGIVLEGASNFSITTNLFSTVKVSNWLSNTGLNNLMNNNQIACNEMQNGNLGILAIGENKEFQFLSNDFILNSDGYDFVLMNDPFYLINGSIRQNQGSSTSMAFNCFSKFDQPDITTLGPTTSFNYYFEDQLFLDCILEPSNPGNYTKIGLEGIPYPDYCVDGGPFNNPLVPTLADLISRRLLIQQLLPSISTDLNSLNQYLKLSQEKELVLKKLLNTSINNAEYLMVENLLNGEQSTAASWIIFGLRLKRQDYLGASSLLEALPIVTQLDQDFRAVQRINIQRLVNQEPILLTEAQGNFLNSLANGNSPIRAYARGILGILENRRYYPEEYDFNLPRSTGKVQPIQNATYHVFPVPADQKLTITVPNKLLNNQVHISMYNLIGQMVYGTEINSEDGQAIIETQLFDSGFYIIEVVEDNKVVFKSKVVIQH